METSCEKTKQFLLLRVLWSSSLVLPKSKNKFKQQALHWGKDCSACIQTQPEVPPHLNVARLQRALGTVSLPWMQTAHFCGMILPWCFCKDSVCDKLLKALLGLQENHTAIPSCFMWQWKQILLPARQRHSFANFPSKLLLHQIKLRY